MGTGLYLTAPPTSLFPVPPFSLEQSNLGTVLIRFRHIKMISLDNLLCSYCILMVRDSRCPDKSLVYITQKGTALYLTASLLYFQLILLKHLTLELPLARLL